MLNIMGKKIFTTTRSKMGLSKPMILHMFTGWVKKAYGKFKA